MRRWLVTLSLGVMLVGANAGAQTTQRNIQQHYRETAVAPISSDTHYTVVASVLGSLTMRHIPLPGGAEFGYGWVPGISMGGQFGLRRRWRATVRGSIQFPRMVLGVTDTAENIFAYVATAEFVARYRFSDQSPWYVGVGGGPSLTITRSTVCIFARCRPHDESAAGISVVGTFEIGANSGDGFQSDFGLRLQAGTPITSLGVILDLGIYLGYHW